MLANQAYRCLNPNQREQYFRAYGNICKRCENGGPVRRQQTPADMDRKAEEIWSRKRDPDYYTADRTSRSMWAEMEKSV